MGGHIDTVNFCGASGASYQFERIGADQDWAKIAGVVLFAAAEGRSWRIIRVGDQGGVEGDLSTFWRWREARRYGATAIFVRRKREIVERRREAADLASGLDPVFAAGSELSKELAHTPELMAA
ncbi:MAG TPA: hypothetical protein VG942_14035 [Hyphomonadaceae bacterium]|nr:hypothetical protein [Hyphomonadaceae bacterium]